MSLRINHFLKTGQVETDTQNSTQSGKEKGQADLFQALLKKLNPDGGPTPVSGFRNQPASSQVIGYGRHGFLTIHTTQGSSSIPQSVNSLAASALIALNAVSAGATEGAGMAGMIAGAAGVGEAARDAGGIYPGQQIGALSARFESGGRGPGVIGYDANGGTSYGTYQISSRAGTMKEFIDYLSRQAPDLAAKLEAAGPADTGSRYGRMPEVWKHIAAEDPDRFEKLQSSFIEKTFYLPTIQKISDRTGLDISKAPVALQEVLWSTAVQHGSNGAAHIFTKAIRKVEGENDRHGVAKLINAVYDMRAGRFESSGHGVRTAVANRFREEGRMALAMLSNENSNGANIG